MRRWVLRLGLLAVAAVVIPACHGRNDSDVQPAGNGPTFTGGGSGASGGGGSTASPAGGTASVTVQNLKSLTQGGLGLILNGGHGSNFNLNAATGSDVRLLPSGTVNSVVNPRVLKPDLGSNPRIVRTSQTWTVNTGSGGVFSGPGDDRVDGNGPGNATGLWVMPGVTLTIHPNVSFSEVRLIFPDGVFIEGTIRIGHNDVSTTGDQQGNDGADFELQVDGNLVITSSGVIDLSGRNGTTGGNGGLFETTGNISTIVNAGRILSIGGDGETGGQGGGLQLISNNYGVYNSGTLDSAGGGGSLIFSGAAPIAGVSNADTVTNTTVYTLESAAPAWLVAGRQVTVSGCFNSNNNNTFTVTAVSGASVTLDNDSGQAESNSPGEITLSGGGPGAGGRGGDITIISNLSANSPGGAFNTGIVNSRGGNGTSGGGTGGIILLLSSGPGAVTSSGTVDSSAGHATAAGANATGVDAGAISIDAGSGTVRLTGLIRARGGNGSGTGDGGRGGDVFISTTEDGSVSDQGVVGGMAIGATFDTTGGSGQTGGDAGTVDILAGDRSSITPGLDIVYLLGYAEINTSGGSGALDGGDAGDITIFNTSSRSGSVDYQGSIRNEVALVGRGGTGTLGIGGQGGLVDITNDSGGANTNRSVVNTASIDVRGGSGELTCGTGGTVAFYDTFRVQNTGAINASGGSAPYYGTGGDGGGISLLSDDVVTNNANLTANGGTSANFNGGWGGTIALQSRGTTSVGSLSADGANGGANPGNLGGSGGVIDIFSTNTTSGVTGTLSVRAGTGEPLVGSGTAGDVQIDGVLRSLTGGAITLP